MKPNFQRPVLEFEPNRRTTVLALIYAIILAVSYFLSYEVRFDFAVPAVYQEERLRLLPMVLGVKLLALIFARQFGSLMTYFSVPDLVRLSWAASAASTVLFLPRLFTAEAVTAPRGVLLIDFMLSLGGLCLGRLAARLYRERLAGARRSRGGTARLQRIAIVGAGDAGATLAKEFISAPSRGFLPVVFFDDDLNKRGKLVHGVPVAGRPETLHELKEIGTIVKAVIAMPSASSKRVREIVALFTGENIKVETLPSLEELASGRVRASRVRPVEVQDLLGREAINLDSAGIKQSVERRVVLVTGAGGSIGSELCRQIAGLNPQRLLLLEQSEGALFLIEQELNELGLGALAVPLVADIIDRERLEFIFSRYKPEVVFHAAAHKHVFLMERQPAEAIRNNVLGTRQLAEIAVAHGVDAFTLISTDKAINPTNVMGATKRLAELQLMAVAARQEAEREPTKRGGGDLSLSAAKPDDQKVIGFQAAAEAALPPVQARGVPADGEAQPAGLKPTAGGAPLPRTKFMAVRFGNVLGSSGSVIPIFKRQIANGGPVTVTHPDVTRYFMTIPEAVGLVLQSFVLGTGGEIFVLDMGRPVKIVDLAKQMIELSGFRVGEDIEITYTGLKPGEKLFEELHHDNEVYAPTAHPRIMRFTSKSTVSEARIAELERNLHRYESNQLKTMLREIVPDYTPFFD